MAFFRRKKDDIDNSIETATAEEAIAKDDNGVYTTLEFHPSQNYSTPQTYVLKFHHEQLPALKPNQISISGIRLIRLKEKAIIEAFIRNTLTQPVQFSALDLVVSDQTGQAVAKKTFNMTAMGSIPALAAMPWKFEFGPESLLAEEIPENDWTIAFELKQPPKEHTLDLDSSWEEQLSEEKIEQLQKIVDGLPKLGEKEVNFTGLQTVFQEDGSLAVSVFIRNGNLKSINIEQLPLEVLDAKGDLVCKGRFSLEKFQVDANATKPWTFTFPKELIQKQEPDFSRWKVIVPNN